MQKKPDFLATNCAIKVPDNTMPSSETANPIQNDEDIDQKKRLQLINFGHSQWGFNNWSWAVTKQDVDFIDYFNGKYTAGVAAFVSVTVKSFDIHRENVGYATTSAPSKGSAVYRARKSAVTNALRETMLSFGANVTMELVEVLESIKSELNQPANAEQENNQNIPNKPHTEIKNLPPKKDTEVNNAKTNLTPIKNIPSPTPAVAKPQPISAVTPANRPPYPANQPPRMLPPQPPRPNSNETKPPAKEKTESSTEEELRAERRRRQKQAQEEFRIKQLKRQNPENHGPELDLHRSSIDKELLDIATQDIIIEDTGNIPEESGPSGSKRRSPDQRASKRRPSLMNKLDIAKD